MIDMNTSKESDPDVYVENPFPKRLVTKTQCKSILMQMKNFQSANENQYYDTMISYLDNILKQVSNRTYQIKNSLSTSSTGVQLTMSMRDHGKVMMRTFHSIGTRHHRCSYTISRHQLAWNMRKEM